VQQPEEAHQYCLYKHPPPPTQSGPQYPTMTRDELLTAFDPIRAWQRGDQRAVHKPLLVLLALARLARGEPPMVEFAALENKLKDPP
jgi:hypothetical protein